MSVINTLDLSDLAPIELHNSAGNERAPSIPKVGHSNLVAQKSNSFGVPVDWLSRFDGELTVDGLINGFVRIWLACYSDISRCKRGIVQHFSLFKVSISCFV